jgi:hypothetical protein
MPMSCLIHWLHASVNMLLGNQRPGSKAIAGEAGAGVGAKHIIYGFRVENPKPAC